MNVSFFTNEDVIRCFTQQLGLLYKFSAKEYQIKELLPRNCLPDQSKNLLNSMTSVYVCIYA